MDRLRVGVLVLFFFQAEDGIRDIGVTGVQTCALPISCGVPPRGHPAWTVSAALFAAPRKSRSGDRLQVVCHGVRLSAAGEIRSEERRVGKECRSRWSPYH